MTAVRLLVAFTVNLPQLPFEAVQLALGLLDLVSKRLFLFRKLLSIELGLREIRFRAFQTHCENLVHAVLQRRDLRRFLYDGQRYVFVALIGAGRHNSLDHNEWHRSVREDRYLETA